ncbi:MAG: hypothetical protein ACFFDN_22840 [Candidatus Hodarchaeota archaeon]
MAKKIKGSVDLVLGKFKFKNENIFKGVVEITKELKKINLNWYVDRKNIFTIKSGEWKIEFHFTLEMKPDFGEINLDGTCIAKSLDQNMPMYLANEFPPVMATINYYIRLECYKKCLKIAMQNNIPLIPVEYFMKLSSKKKS